MGSNCNDTDVVVSPLYHIIARTPRTATTWTRTTARKGAE